MLKNESSTLVGLLEGRASRLSDQHVYTFLNSGELGDATALGYGDLASRARAVGAFLQRSGLAGERVLLLYPPGLDFIVAFFGCLYAGAVSIPAYPPRSKRSLPRLLAISRDARPAAALAPARSLPRLDAMAARVPELRQLRQISTEEALATSPDAWRPPDLDAGSLAFLQYTSGSTSSPRGVEVSHGNLLHNQEMIKRAFAQSESSVIVGWLPLYHDMGLIGNVLQPLYLGARCVLMSPAAFLQRPRRWLEAIDHYRATTSGGPNFAYELCVRRISEADRAGLDLGTWSVAFNGAEPVRSSSLDGFARAFAANGFRREAFYPCYGLAEATLLVTGGSVETEPRVAAFEAGALEAHRVVSAEKGSPGARELVSCGRPWLGQEVAIVDPAARRRAAAGEVGEIWVRGPSVARGYWRRPEANERIFRARLVGEEGEFLRTGDLGFVDAGEVFVTGRLKDLVILRGRNHYPQDLELTAERAHPSLRPGCGAAFSVEVEGEERLAMVWELERRASADDGEIEAIAGAVRQALAEVHEVQLHEIVLLRAGTIPKTSSGKIRRHACRAGHLSGELDVLARSALGTEPGGGAGARDGSGASSKILDRRAILELEKDRRAPALVEALRREAARALRLSPGDVDVGLPLTRQGLDSLAAVEIAQSLEETLGVGLPLGELLEGIDLESLAHDLSRRLESPGEPPRSAEPPEAGMEEFALSHGQRALFFLHRLAPASAAYHIAAAARVRPGGDGAALDTEALERALGALARRHPALRTSFHLGDGEPWQRLQADPEIELEVLDAAAWGGEELARRLEREAHRPFVLEAGSLWRVVVFRGAQGGDVILFAIHHIIADFWSLAIVARDLGALYRLEHEGSAGVELPAPPSWDYGAWVAWQRELLAGERGERLWRYWRERLADLPPVLELPTDRPRPPVQTYAGAASLSPLDGQLSAAVRELAHGRGTTLFTVLLAAFQALLYRLTDRGDLSVGAPAAGRGRPELADVVGYFTDPVVLRAELSGRTAFETLLDQARKRVIEALEHQDHPFALLAERLQPERDASRSPLFQVMHVHQRSPDAATPEFAAFAVQQTGAELELGGLSLESLALEQRTAQFDLTLETAELGGELITALRYNTDLFDATTAERLLSHLRRLLAGATARPELPVAELPLLSETERSAVLEHWSWGGEIEVPEVSIVELFERRVAADPEAEALSWAEDGVLERLSYGELDRRANRLARALSRRGVGPEARVAVCLERSAELVVTLLAVLKAGGAYVPLDPAYPAERISYMLEASGAVVLVARGAEPSAEIPRLDPGDPALADEDPTPPRTAAGPRNLAWVIYTSGSTGRPKGVAIEHRSGVHLIRWARQIWSDEELAGVLASTSVCFDLSVFEIFVPLAWGGRVILAENALALARHPAASEVSLLNTVPSAMAELSAGELPPGLVTVNLAGEPLSPSLVAEIGRHPQVERLYNLYGPSEDTTYSTWARFDPGEGAPERMTIGRPLAGTRALVLDRFLHPVPPGVVGELFLGGPGMARCYAGDPAPSAERFVPDPWAERPGSRLYRTGDRVRFLPSGELDYVGRRDQQVKIRGFRIEPGEVEAALGRLVGVREAAVVVRDDLPGGRALVAFASSKSGAGEPAELERRWRSELEAELPRYLVPPFLAVIAELPHTPNGKIDRRALIQSPLPPAFTAAPYLAPRTPVEETLAGIFAELLGLEEVGIHDDFFARGGHSLLAVRLASRLHGDLGVELPLDEIFRSPTVAELARSIESAALRSAEAIPSRPEAPGGPAPLSSGQKRLWFLARMQPESPSYNMPIALELRGEPRPAAIEAALREIVRRHEVLRTRFERVAGEPVQRVDPARGRRLARLDLSALAERAARSELKRVAEAEARRPFDLTGGPLLRTVWVHLGERRHALLAVAHHAVADGESLEILGRELSILYRTALGGEVSPLEPLPIQYGDFAVWQKRWLESDAAAFELEYWSDQLAGAPSTLELPTDRPRPPVLSHAGARRRLEIDAALPEALERLARRRGLTGFMSLAAVFGALLARRAGQPEVLVGSPAASRGRSELQGMIGFLVNTVVLRLDPGFDETVVAYLERVRQMALGAYAHHGLPFDRVIEELAPVTDLSRSPLFQAMILLEEPPLGEVELPGLEAGLLDIHTGTAKFDLTLRLEPREERWLATAEYATDLYDRTTVDRLLRGYRRALRFFAGAGMETRLSALPLLSGAERHQLLVEIDDTPTLERAEATSSTLFAERARGSSEAIALGEGELQLSFGHLARRVGALARRLRAAEIGPDDRVGLFLPRSVEQIVGLLAILEAGAAYVPLDPEYPIGRLRQIAEEAELAAILTREDLRERAPGAEGTAMLCVDGHADAVEPSRPAISPDNLAYAIYTSGSTGRPKGVMVAHRSAVDLLGALELAIYRGEPSRVALNASLMFDASVKQWLQLLNGRRLELVPGDVRLEVRRLGPHLARHRVDVIDLTPAQLGALIDSGEPLPKRVLVGGEEISPALWRRLAAIPEVRAWNVYGPTECTVDTTVAEIGPGEPRLGRPIAGARLRLLDRHFEPVPLGVDAQLWIGGAGLARGYLGRPGLSAERFVPDPWSRRPGARLYASGDRVRVRGDGGLVFVGRVDRQVKIRGFRIELGEIEAVLAEHPAVREAAVVVDAEAAEGPRMIAYASDGEGAPALVEALRAHLQERLPRYMVPPLIVPLAALPRTPNGKLDRAALPAPEPVRDEEPTAPRDPVEEVLAGMMAEVLERESVGIHDNFFELGGHSLLAAELVAMIQDAFQIELPLLHIFETASVAELAETLNNDPELGEQVRSVAPILLELAELPEEVAEPS